MSAAHLFSREGRGYSFTALGISTHLEDLNRLRDILSRMEWRLHEAQSCHEAMIQLCAHRMPIILCDRSLPDGNWKDILSLTAPLLDPPRVIVMSEEVGDSWSTEVLDMHAYGVLAKPLEEGEVTRVLLACASWQSEWASMHASANSV
jgi:DNA-binding NarL/FixJ family response regulator